MTGEPRTKMQYLSGIAQKSKRFYASFQNWDGLRGRARACYSSNEIAARHAPDLVIRNANQGGARVLEQIATMEFGPRSVRSCPFWLDVEGNAGERIRFAPDLLIECSFADDDGKPQRLMLLAHVLTEYRLRQQTREWLIAGDGAVDWASRQPSAGVAFLPKRHLLDVLNAMRRDRFCTPW